MLQAEVLNGPGFLVSGEMEAAAGALLPSRKGPAFTVCHTAMLLHGNISFPIDFPSQQRLTYMIPF